MQGLQLTYDTLGETRNEAAVDVLLAALDDADADHRANALTMLLLRKEPRAPEQVLENWSKLSPDDLGPLRSNKDWMSATVEQALGKTEPEALTAIEAAEVLGLTSTLKPLILMAESSASREVKRRSSEAVIKLVRPLGEAARDDRNQPTVRSPVQAALADSVRRFKMHRNEHLVDAFLLVSTWSDSKLLQLINAGGRDTKLLCDRFTHSEESGILDLLAGSVRRKSIPRELAQIVQSRPDEQLRVALLHQIGCEPNATIQRSLSNIGIPYSCRGGAKLLDVVAPDCIAPLIALYLAAKKDTLETLHLITAAIAFGGPEVEAAAVTGFSHCEVTDLGFWMRAAVDVADAHEEETASDENARLLTQLIRLLDHSNPSLSRSVRHVLAPLHAEQMLQKFQSLRLRSRRRLGKVVMMIDPDAVQLVQDRLNHQVLNHRLEAIAAADALDIVDELSDSFAHIVHGDHQTARVQAAEAMAGARGAVTLQLLQEMANLPECSVRDAAVQAIEGRQGIPIR
jgi:hypothetical protein